MLLEPYYTHTKLKRLSPPHSLIYTDSIILRVSLSQLNARELLNTQKILNKMSRSMYRINLERFRIETKNVTQMI